MTAVAAPVRSAGRGPMAAGWPHSVRSVDLVAALETLALLVLVGFGVNGVARIFLALGFVSFAPGWAALGHWRAVDGITRVALAVVLSLTICTAAALAMAWRGSWEPLALFYGLGGMTLLTLLWKVGRPRRLPLGPGDEVVLPAPDCWGGDPEPPTVRAEPETPPQPAWALENLKITRVSVHVGYLPRAPLSRGELTAFFAGIQERHPFTSFVMRPDDVTIMEADGARRLEIGRGGADYWEAERTAFPQVLRDAVDLLGEVQRRLSVPVLADSSCRLQASCELPPGKLGALACPAGVGERQTALLGATGPVGVGLLLTGQAGPSGTTWRVMLGPDGDGRLSLDVAMDSATVTEGPSRVGEVLAEAHVFLTENVSRFLESVAAGSTAGARSNR